MGSRMGRRRAVAAAACTAAASRHAFTSRRLLPRRAYRFANKECRVGAGTRAELLRAALVDFGHVDVSLLVDADVVHAPEPAGEVTPRTPRVEEVSLEVVLQDLARTAIGLPEIAVGGDVEHVDVRRVVAEFPLIQELAVLVEHLRPVVAAIVDEHAP